MVKFTIAEVRAIMDKPKNIRNMTVIAHVDHGKSTLTDSLVGAAGIIKMEDVGDRRIMDTRDDEQARTITIKSSGISLHFHLSETELQTLPEDCDPTSRDFLFNLIDSPGHVDFSSEVTAALRVTDGGLVIVDCVEGVSVQTETVLRQALQERIKPVLVVNKLDRALLELKLDGEEQYGNYVRIIENANVIISTYMDDLLGDVSVAPENGTVAFAAGLHAWAFTLDKFARMYAKKFGMDAKALTKKLWGDWYFDPEIKKWTQSSTSSSGAPLRRGFVQLCLDPIAKVIEMTMRQDYEGLEKVLKAVNLTLTKSDREKDGKKLMKAIMMKWLPASDALLEMMILHLPSPVKAQAYRVSNLYTGPLDDKAAQSIAACDKNGPLVVYISKMVPTSDNNRFFSFGRVFSGTVKTGQKVRIMGPNYEHGKKGDLFVHAVQRTVIMMGKFAEAVDDVPCGNTVAIVGIDSFLSKAGTLAGEFDEETHPLTTMKFSVSPVVRVAVEPKFPSDLPKLVEGLKRLTKSDPLVQCSVEKTTGEHVIAGAGELHLEICLKDLQDDFMGGAPLRISNPVVSFCETVTEESSQMCLAKSGNKHNRLYAKAKPMASALVEAIEKKEIDLKEEPKSLVRTLTDDYGMDNFEAKKIWSWGPDGNGPNVLIDATRGLQYMNEIKDSVVGGFEWVSREGVLCGEQMRGVEFRVFDATIHTDSAHRGGGEIIPCSRRVFYAAQFLASPHLQEPVYNVDITCPQSSVGRVYSCLSMRRGRIVEEIPRPGTPLYNLRGFLPVMESFGFTGALRAATSGTALPAM